MAKPTFYRLLSLISGATALLLLVLGQFSIFRPYLPFSFACLSLFLILTLAMYIVGEKTARSSNKSLFTSMVLVFTFGKILLSFAIVLLYYYLAAPASKVFLLPFFIVYLIFTIFETYLMMQIGKYEKPSAKEA